MKRFLPLLRSLAVLLGAALLFACQKPDIGGPDDSGGGKPGKRLDYTTHSNGYSMPGEPGSPYRHPLGGYYDLDE